MPTPISCDVAIVGGGLSGGLIALALAAKRPDLAVVLIEGADSLGGNHIWSFFGSDVSAQDRWLVAPLVAHAWKAYDIAFPRRQRTLANPYYSTTSENLDAVVRAKLPPDAILTGRQVLDVTPTSVVLADGVIAAGGVIDARGASDISALDVGWQKFLGREFYTKQSHGAERPVVMDGTVEQIDGYRFVYTLPFAANRIFIEDTYYSDTPGFDRHVLARRIDAYAKAKGWKAKSVMREEAGALPVVIGGDFDGYWRAGGADVAKAGARAGLFHPTTGYSLPDAVRLALRIAQADDLSGAALHALTYDYARTNWQARRFYRMLDAMLFKAADPGERYRVLERFYGLDAGLIGRFYAGHSTFIDKARVLIGKPPVPVGRAIAALRSTRF